MLSIDLQNLAIAIRLMTDEMKRANDLKQPAPILKRSEIEIGKAEYGREREREVEEELKGLDKSSGVRVISSVPNPPPRHPRKSTPVRKR